MTESCLGGAKGVFGGGAKSLSKVTCTWANKVCARAAPCCASATSLLLWELETVAANKVAAINPPVDDTDPTRKFSIDPRIHMDLQNPAEFSRKGKLIQNFSIDPTLSIRARLLTPFLRTPFPRLLFAPVSAKTFAPPPKHFGPDQLI